jgi:hypothetical protein
MSEHPIDKLQRLIKLKDQLVKECDDIRDNILEPRRRKLHEVWNAMANACAQLGHFHDKAAEHGVQYYCKVCKRYCHAVVPQGPQVPDISEGNKPSTSN